MRFHDILRILHGIDRDPRPVYELASSTNASASASILLRMKSIWQFITSNIASNWLIDRKKLYCCLNTILKLHITKQVWQLKPPITQAVIIANTNV